MRPRAYNPDTDLAGLSKLVNGQFGDLQVSSDAIIVVEEDGRLVGAVALRPIIFVHELAIEKGILSRKIADEALCYAMGTARALGHREGVFVVAEDNLRMQKWLEDRGAKKQPGLVYTMEVK